MMENRQVVVTGMGAISPVGNTVAECWQNLVAGKSGIGPVTHFPAADFRCQIAGEVRGLQVDKFLDPKAARRMSPFCHFAVGAANEALVQAGLIEGGVDPLRAGVLVSSGIGGLDFLSEQTLRCYSAGPARISPLTVTMMISNMASAHISMKYQFQGPNFGIASACATGLHSIGEAFWMIRRGDADVMVAGGTEEGVSRMGHAAFGQLRALSERNDDPEHASRPFDMERDGFVPAEGAGVLVLEERSHAEARGAKILAEVIGYGLSGDAFHMTAPREDGTVAAAAIRRAMQVAGITPDEIDYVNAHGTSTPLNDKTETIVLKLALGEEAARKVAISSTKSMTGHMLGAAGGFESVVCVKAIEEGIVPPTINLTHPDPACDLDYVPNTARKMPVKVALKVSFGFGGQNAAVLFRAPEH